MRRFRAYLVSHTDVAELATLNLLGIQFALCEAELREARPGEEGSAQNSKKSDVLGRLFFEGRSSRN